MKKKQKTYLLYGASGGLGRAILKALRAQGAVVIAGGRSREKLVKLHQEEGLKEDFFLAGLNSPQDLEQAFIAMANRGQSIDGVILAAGFDARKFHHELTDDEVRETLSTNVTGPAFLLRAYLQVFQKKGEGCFAVIGGFGDGRLAFPGHALDSASRAAVFTLLEGVRRENPQMRTLYFCPPAVETEAEFPWLPLWKELGVPIYSPDQAAREFVHVLAGHKSWHMSGTCLDRFGVKLNGWSAQLADRLFLAGMHERIITYIKKGSI